MNKIYVKVLVEGNEESAFFDVVNEKGKKENIYLDIEDVSGYGNMEEACLEALREEIYDCVICVYDVDNKICEKDSPYNNVRKKLFAIFGNEEEVESVSFCSNPNILQYFLLAADTLDSVKIVSSSKKENSKLVHKYWPEIASNKTDKNGKKIKSEYAAHKWQLDIIKYSIINEEYSYENLLKNAKELPLDYKKNLPGGNLYPLLVAIKDGNEMYFSELSKLIYSKND